MLDDEKRNKRRLFSGWMLSSTGEEVEPGEAPRYEKQEIVVNVEWNDFLVIKTCHNAFFDVSRSLHYVHPLIGNALAGTDVPLCRSVTSSGNKNAVVFCFSTPKGTVHLLNAVIDDENGGLGEDWEEEKQQQIGSNMNPVMRVLKRLNWAVQASAQGDSVWPVRKAYG